MLFETKLTKYSNLIQAYQDATLNENEEGRQYYVSTQKQMELIATDEIIELSQEFYKPSNVQHSSLIRDKLVNAMRKDLKKYY